MNIANIVGGIASIAWIAAIGAIALVVMQASRRQPMRSGPVIVGVLLVLAVVVSTISAGLVFVNPMECGVVISAFAPKGYRDEALQPGLRWIMPYVETVVTYPISRQTYTMSIAPSEGKIQGDDSIAARTSDGQEIYVDASVIFAIDPAKAVQVHVTWQTRYDNDLVRPQVRGIIRDVVSQYGVEQVVTSKRLEMTKQISETLTKKLSENGLLMVDFILRNITFSEEYAKSVEQKQVAEQQAQQAKLVVEQRKNEAEQARQVALGKRDAAISEAEGQANARLKLAEAEANSLRLIAAALKESPDLLTYSYINKLSPNVEVMFLPNNSPFIFPLPTPKAP